MHHGGGPRGKKNVLRCAAVRQRGAAAFAWVINSWVFADVSHSRAVLSSDVVTIRLPSGLNAALDTEPWWPLSGSPMGLPVSASHRRTVLSSEVVTMRFPSGLNTALYTGPS